MTMDKSEVQTEKTDKLEKSEKKTENGSVKPEKDKKADRNENGVSDRKGDKSDKSGKKTEKGDKPEKETKVENGDVNGVVNGETASVDGEGDEEDGLLDEEREKLHRVLTGELEDLPPLGSKIVRIFTSSTFTGKCGTLHFFLSPPYTRESNVTLRVNTTLLCRFFLVTWVHGLNVVLQR